MMKLNYKRNILLHVFALSYALFNFSSYFYAIDQVPIMEDGPVEKWSKFSIIAGTALCLLASLYGTSVENLINGMDFFKQTDEEKPLLAVTEKLDAADVKVNIEPYSDAAPAMKRQSSDTFRFDRRSSNILEKCGMNGTVIFLGSLLKTAAVSLVAAKNAVWLVHKFGAKSHTASQATAITAGVFSAIFNLPTQIAMGSSENAERSLLMRSLGYGMRQISTKAIARISNGLGTLLYIDNAFTILQGFKVHINHWDNVEDGLLSTLLYAGILVPAFSVVVAVNISFYNSLVRFFSNQGLLTAEEEKKFKAEPMVEKTIVGKAADREHNIPADNRFIYHTWTQGLYKAGLNCITGFYLMVTLGGLALNKDEVKVPAAIVTAFLSVGNLMVCVAQGRLRVRGKISQASPANGTVTPGAVSTDSDDSSEEVVQDPATGSKKLPSGIFVRSPKPQQQNPATELTKTPPHAASEKDGAKLGSRRVEGTARRPVV